MLARTSGFNVILFSLFNLYSLGDPNWNQQHSEALVAIESSFVFELLHFVY